MEKIKKFAITTMLVFAIVSAFTPQNAEACRRWDDKCYYGYWGCLWHPGYFCEVNCDTGGGGGDDGGPLPSGG